MTNRRVWLYQNLPGQAFDVVNHRIVLKLLRRIGLRTDLNAPNISNLMGHNLLGLPQLIHKFC